MSVTQLPASMLYNGDMIIARTDKKTIESVGNHFDTNSLKAMYSQDTEAHNLGLITLRGQGVTTALPIYSGLLQDKKMLEIDNRNGYVDYEIANKDSGKCLTIRDTSVEYPYAGMDETVFRIVLNKKYEPGDILTPSLFKGKVQLMVDDKGGEEVRQVVGGWSHPCTYMTQDRRAYYDPQYLKAGIEYFKVSQSTGGEYGTRYGGINFGGGSTTMKIRFQLNNQAGHEFSMTGKAMRGQLSGAVSEMEAGAFGAEIDLYGEFGMITKQSNLLLGSDGKFNFKKGSKISVTSMLPIYLHKEHHKVVAKQVLFQDAATFRGQNGSEIVKLNEGIYKQMRRGKIISYGRPMGMTRVDIAEAVEYIFIGNPLPVEQRKVTFSCGKHVIQNFYQIFKDEINFQNMGVEKWEGSAMLLPKSPISGTNLMELSYEGVRFTKVMIMDIGEITVKHDPSLDYRPGEDRFISGMHSGGFAHTTYSAVIWDTESKAHSNNKQVVSGATLVEGGDARANMYLVKPQGAMTTFGSEWGRAGTEERGYTDLVSSSRTQMGSWWIYSSVAALVLDKSRFCIIELDESVEAGFN
jgi:hypothetical protein